MKFPRNFRKFRGNFNEIPRKLQEVFDKCPTSLREVCLFRCNAFGSKCHVFVRDLYTQCSHCHSFDRLTLCNVSGSAASEARSGARSAAMPARKRPASSDRAFNARGRGQRQRLANLGLARPGGGAPDASAESALVAYLLKEVSWGRISTITAQTIAGKALLDCESALEMGSVHPRIREMARAGQEGAHPGNTARNVFSMFPCARMLNVMETFKITATYWAGPLRKTDKVDRGSINALRTLVSPQMERPMCRHVWFPVRLDFFRWTRT